LYRLATTPPVSLHPDLHDRPQKATWLRK
jgi:hypothetical protein